VRDRFFDTMNAAQLVVAPIFVCFASLNRSNTIVKRAPASVIGRRGSKHSDVISLSNPRKLEIFVKLNNEDDRGDSDGQGPYLILLTFPFCMLTGRLPQGEEDVRPER